MQASEARSVRSFRTLLDDLATLIRNTGLGPRALREPKNEAAHRRCRGQQHPPKHPSTVIVTECEPGFEARRHPVEEGAEFQWDWLAWRIDDVDRQGLRLEVLQNQF